MTKAELRRIVDEVCPVRYHLRLDERWAYNEATVTIRLTRWSWLTFGFSKRQREVRDALMPWLEAAIPVGVRLRVR